MIDNGTPQLSDRELLVRIDTKLDGVIEDKKDHEVRIRAFEDKLPHLATIVQLNAVEVQAQGAVTRKQLWAAAGAVFAAAGSIFPIIQWIANK